MDIAFNLNKDNPVRMIKLEATITFKALKCYEDLVKVLARQERRKDGFVARAIFERGIASFARDLELFELDPPNVEEIIKRIEKETPASAGKKENASTKIALAPTAGASKVKGPERKSS